MQSKIFINQHLLTNKYVESMKQLLFAFMAMSVFTVSADKKDVDLKEVKSTKDKTETAVEPKASYDDESNTVELAIEAEESFWMKVIDSTGRVVYTCPVIMVDGTPTNYLLPQLSPGIYTLKVESTTTIYESNCKITNT